MPFASFVSLSPSLAVPYSVCGALTYPKQFTNILAGHTTPSKGLNSFDLGSGKFAAWIFFARLFATCMIISVYSLLYIYTFWFWFYVVRVSTPTMVTTVGCFMTLGYLAMIFFADDAVCIEKRWPTIGGEPAHKAIPQGFAYGAEPRPALIGVIGSAYKLLDAVESWFSYRCHTYVLTICKLLRQVIRG